VILEPSASVAASSDILGIMMRSIAKLDSKVFQDSSGRSICIKKDFMRDLTRGSVTKHLLHMSAFMAVSMVAQTLYLLADLY
jgi:hypothetical protein